MSVLERYPSYRGSEKHWHSTKRVKSIAYCGRVRPNKYRNGLLEQSNDLTVSCILWYDLLYFDSNFDKTPILIVKICWKIQISKIFKFGLPTKKNFKFPPILTILGQIFPIRNLLIFFTLETCWLSIYFAHFGKVSWL